MGKGRSLPCGQHVMCEKDQLWQFQQLVSDIGAIVPLQKRLCSVIHTDLMNKDSFILIKLYAMTVLLGLFRLCWRGGWQ